MKILISAEYFLPATRAGGPPVSLGHLVSTSAFDIALNCRDRDLGATEPFGTEFRGETVQGNALVHYADMGTLRGMLKAMLWMRHHCGQVLYLNSFHSLKATVIPLLSVHVGWLKADKIIMSPRGEFNPAALELGSRLKWRYISLWKRLGIQRRVIWIASSEKELREIRAVWGSDVRAYLVPESVRLAPRPAPTGGGSGPQLRATFIGRVAPIKGLLEALLALKNVREPVAFDIFGPIEDPAYWALCQAAIADLPSNITASYQGVRPRDAVPSILASSDVLLLPTFGENFGHVIGESLAMSCPVIVGINTPWSGYLTNGAGIAVEPNDVEAIADAIVTYAQMPDAERRDSRRQALGAARAWIENAASFYTFDQVVLDVVRPLPDGRRAPA